MRANSTVQFTTTTAISLGKHWQLVLLAGGITLGFQSLILVAITRHCLRKHFAPSSVCRQRNTDDMDSSQPRA